MTNDEKNDTEKLGEEIAALRPLLIQFTVDLARQMEICKMCRPIVLGNGRDSIDKRVARIEEARAVWWKAALIAGTIASIVAGLLPFAVQAAAKVF